MYGYIPPSNAGYQNNYPPYGGQRQPLYPPRPYPPSQPSSYQPSSYQPSSYQPQRPNTNYRNVSTVMQPLALNIALEQSSYPTNNKDYIKNLIINDYFENKNAKVFFNPQEKIFVVEYTLGVNFGSKIYNLTLYIHIPQFFPNFPPEFYIQKKPKTGLNKNYLNGKIDPITFQINLESFEKFDISKNSFKNIIEEILDEFNSDFPIYKDTKDKRMETEIFGRNNIDKKSYNEIIITSDTFTDEQFMIFMKNQVKDVLREKMSKLSQQFRVDKNYADLKQMNEVVKMHNVNNNSDASSNPMHAKLENLKNIKQQLNQMEYRLQQEIQQTLNNTKTPLEKCDDYISIKDQKDMEYVVMKKTIEDYLVYLKKGYEKKVVSFNDMVNLTRNLSRELFSIDYLRKQRKNYY